LPLFDFFALRRFSRWSAQRMCLPALRVATSGAARRRV